MSSDWIKSRHGYRLSKASHNKTLILCTIHNRWHPQASTRRFGHTSQTGDAICPDCKQDQETLNLRGAHLGIPYNERLWPENLARIEESAGRKLLRYHKRG